MLLHDYNNALRLVVDFTYFVWLGLNYKQTPILHIGLYMIDYNDTFGLGLFRH